MDENQIEYAKCRDCHLFVEANYSAEMYPDEGYAPYVHLHGGTAEDEKIDESHEAQPGEVRTLAWWRQFGPPEMLERFTD
ncbi:Uncharacterised protein (plasmid) [Tsukamurella tyrosinosolvens]|uniref:Uncharacterized protein n=1 Tax=Tsukamurella tyrosinosolvens TaxID=57704 RepID=A0A1H4US82_TSUTY|nr:hypothetical protein [Tsukamurella tyrosinosolvens]KXO98381.1 hypothetical protein AXK58_25135 [Tsukamurella tyrosinosolvens]SEC71742.1 hypothetical protein SAMN04489793_3011 [Tsukamurella tyrosinosolvens]VEH90895.1 Uncharacterised protein [Tsukamurella tyrosinosolvens]